jgi:hypothetical protein
MPLTGGNLPWKEKDCCLLLDGLEKNYRGAPGTARPSQCAKGCEIAE